MKTVTIPTKCVICEGNYSHCKACGGKGVLYITETDDQVDNSRNKYLPYTPPYVVPYVPLVVNPPSVYPYWPCSINNL